MLAAAVVAQDGLPTKVVREARYSACGSVGDCQLLAGRVVEAGELDCRVGARDAIPVQVLHVIELAVGAEGMQQARRFAEREERPTQRRENGVIAWLSEISSRAGAAAVRLEHAP